jgi:hypothetical protein
MKIIKSRDNNEIELLKKIYPQYGKMYCVELLWRSESSIRAKTSELWIRQDRNSDFFKQWQLKAKKSKIWKKRPLHSIRMKKYFSENKVIWRNVITEENKKQRSITTKKYIKEKWHPRWMLWKTHTNEVRNFLSNKSKVMWNDPKSYVNTLEYRQKLSDRMSKLQWQWRYKNSYSRAKKSKYNHNNKIYSLRSDRERIYCIYLDMIQKWNKIKDWEYESETFRFEAIKRWVRSYKPDFKIYKLDWSIEYHEVKWWMDNKSKTKIKRMAKYYPSITIKIVWETEIKSLKKYIL